MRSFLDMMKVSAVGAILLSALAACDGKPESNPTPPESDQVEVIIEQVVDGKVVDTRAVGRTDVVKYNARSDGDDVAQIEWPDDVNCNDPFDFIYWAKPGLYLKAGGYRFNQTESPQMTTFGIDTYGQTEAIKQVRQKVTCYPKGNKKIYVRLEYENLNNPNLSPKYDYVIYSENLILERETRIDQVGQVFRVESPTGKPINGLSVRCLVDVHPFNYYYIYHKRLSPEDPIHGGSGPNVPEKVWKSKTYHYERSFNPDVNPRAQLNVSLKFDGDYITHQTIAEMLGIATPPGDTYGSQEDYDYVEGPILTEPYSGGLFRYISPLVSLSTQGKGILLDYRKK